MRGILLGVALLAAACGGERSVASKSAAAYDEATAKGLEITGGHEHGSHDAAPSTDTGVAPMDHGAMDHSAMDHSAMNHGAMDHSAMDHSAMDHGAPAEAHAGHSMPGGMTMDHSAHGGTSAASHAGHTAPSTGMAAMDHSQHAASSGAAAAPIAIAAPRSNAEIRNIQPSATLQADPFDAPAPVSVNEAAKATQSGAAASPAHHDHGGH